MSVPLGLNAQRAFEDAANNKQVQALLSLLGDKQAQVIDWTITNHAQHTDYATFRVVFQDESEARGYISLVPATCKWIAGGAIQARRIRETEEQENG